MSSPNAHKVQYRRLGKTGLRVSVPIVGAMSFGNTDWADWVVPEEPAIEILQAAYDLGINTIDTANIYSNGESECIIGKWIKQIGGFPTTYTPKNNIPRERVIIATKCWGLVAKEPGVWALFHPEMAHERDYVNQSGLSRAAIFNAVEASLARLQTTYIDLFQIHRFDPHTPPEETMKALHDLVESGKVRYIGASSMRVWQFALLNEVADKHGWTKFVSMQNEYSLLYREEEREMNAYCNFHGIGLIPWAPLSAGTLARPLNVAETKRQELTKGSPFAKIVTEVDKEIVKRVEELAKKKGVKMGQIALSWAASKVSSPIVGISSLQRLQESVISDEITLTHEELKYLEELYEPKPAVALQNAPAVNQSSLKPQDLKTNQDVPRWLTPAPVSNLSYMLAPIT
ncbi:hypothetical protein H0H92_007138 [Tricholoma furcatifolium]|nr:hypothetical protein H0H92_007138 [Tricholoma furcatifolium]